MNWMEQAQQAAESWSKAQQELWDSAVRTSETARAHQAAEEARRYIEAWETAVNQALDAQAEWTRQWATAITEAPATPEFLAEQVTRIQELVGKWTDAQRQLYAKSLEALREQYPGFDADALEQATRDAAKAWDEAVAKAADAQQRWVEAYASAGADGGGQSAP